MVNAQKFGLALSGGGIRAMVFHCGVVRWLAENKKLEQIHQVSSVSGGSLFVGLMFSLNDLIWPSSEEYLEKIEPSIKNILLNTNLQSTALFSLIYPRNWKYILSRANILSQAISKIWNVNTKISDLPVKPEWSVNGTTAETGKRFRFKRTECGDYEIGYANSKDFSLADIMAISAAFPIGIGPYVINTTEMTWKKRKSWGDSPDNAKEIVPQFQNLHVYDGGVYDNLGQEPLFDVGKRVFKKEIDVLLISDAGAPLRFTEPGSVVSPLRAKRIADIALEQTRSLRVRSYVNFLLENPWAGSYFQIGSYPESNIEKYQAQNELIASQLLSDQWLNSATVRKASSYPTNLKNIELEDFKIIEQHGYETAKWNMMLFSKEKRKNGSPAEDY